MKFTEALKKVRESDFAVNNPHSVDRPKKREYAAMFYQTGYDDAMEKMTERDKSMVILGMAIGILLSVLFISIFISIF